jgi:tryptophanyl-tRNA synthetase
METLQRTRVMSGTRPTGRLHIGHLVGALGQWVELQDTSDVYFEIADIHAFTTGFEHPQQIRDSREDLVLDWLAAGVDPARATLFLQSGVPEISELHTLLSMIVPLSWLQRVPTFKEQIREIVRRFNHLYGETLVEPDAILSEFPAVPGTDGRKMSKSYHNTIDLADDEEATRKKIRAAVTDPKKVRRNDPGEPEICPVFALHHLSNDARVPWIRDHCRTGELGCVDCKTELADSMNAWLRPVRERRASFDRATIDGIIADGTERARIVAAGTIRDVKRAMKLL